mgnify:CR=1
MINSPVHKELHKHACFKQARKKNESLEFFINKYAVFHLFDTGL